MPIRNPFNRRPGTVIVAPHDETGAPETMSTPVFERIDTLGYKASSSFLSIRSARRQDTGEYKMSGVLDEHEKALAAVVNDNGVYLPPSPTEAKGLWPRRYLSSRKSSDTDTRSSQGDLEPFSISRESFDSYRRSFDISAKRPVINHVPARQSLDYCAQLEPLSRRSDDVKTDDEFDDVALDDKQPQARKRGFFSKLGETQDRLLPGRKRGQSGQDSELRNMGRM